MLRKVRATRRIYLTIFIVLLSSSLTPTTEASGEYRTVEVAGQVYDPTGDLVNDVTAMAKSVATNETFGPTTANGGYALGGLAPGAYDITLTAPSSTGLAPITERYVLDGQTQNQFYNIQMAPNYNHFSGQLTDSQNNPLPNVGVHLDYQSNSPSSIGIEYSTTTDAIGAFDIMAAPSQYEILLETIYRPHNPLQIRLGSVSGTFNDIDLRTGSLTQNLKVPFVNVTVPVEDGAGQPVPNFPITIQARGLHTIQLWPGGPSYVAYSADTDISGGTPGEADYGEATMRVVAGLDYEICGGSPRNAGATETSSTVTTRFCRLDRILMDKDSRENLSTATHTFSGIVRDNRGLPIPGTRVSIFPDAVEFGELGVITDSNGGFSITSQRSPHRLYVLNERNTGERPQAFSLASDVPVVDLSSGPVVQDLTLAVSTVNVHVEDAEGYPLSDVRVIGQSPGRVGSAFLWANGPGLVGYSYDTHLTDHTGNIRFNAVQGFGYDICAEYFNNVFCVPGQPVITGDTSYVIHIPEQVPPVIQSLTWSANPLPQGQSTTLNIRATDDTAVSKLEYTVDNGDPQPMVFNTATSTWQALLGANSPLPASTYTVNVIATDVNGNRSDPKTDILAVYNSTNGHVGGRAKVLPNSYDALPVAIDMSPKPTNLLIGFTSNQSGTTSVDIEYTVKNNKDGFTVSGSAIKWAVVPDNFHASIMATGSLGAYISGNHSSMTDVSMRIDVVMNSDGRTGSISLNVWAPGDNPSMAAPLYTVTNAALLPTSNISIKKAA